MRHEPHRSCRYWRFGTNRHIIGTLRTFPRPLHPDVISSLVSFCIAILLPALLLGWIGLALLRCKPAWGRRLIAVMLLSLTVLSMPVMPKRAMLWLESYAGSPLALESLKPVDGQAGRDAVMPQAIVILGAGAVIAPEYGTHTLGAVSLQRVRYGAWLARRTKLPVLVSGGNPDDTPQPEAWYMQQALTEELGQPARWVEDTSANTHENAINSAALLKAAGIRRIYLVTTASHMMRARRSFELAGLEVIPAPTVYSGRAFSLFWDDYVPNPASLSLWQELLHEVLGIVAYRLRGN